MARIGLLADSNDPFWVEVRETIWQCSNPQRFGGLLPPDLAAEMTCTDIELIEIESGGRALADETLAAKTEEIEALDLDALIAVPFSSGLLWRLLEGGLPVISLHARTIDHPLFTAPETLYAAAEMACRHLVERLDGRGCVLVVGGRLDCSPEARSSRIQAALDAFAHCPDLRFEHVPAPWDYDGAAQAVAEALDPGEEPFDGLFGLSDTLALAGMETGRRLGRLAEGAVVVGINGDPLAIAAVANGAMAATVATSASDLAQEALRLACRAARGERLPATFAYRPRLVTAANVAEEALHKLMAIADLPTRLVGASLRQEAQRLTQLETGLAINRRIGSILDRQALPQAIADLIRANYGYDQVQVFLWNEEEHALILEAPDLPPNVRLRTPLADSAALGQALLCRRPVLIPDLGRSGRFAPDPAWPETRTRVVVPIRLGERVLGVLDLHSRRLQRRAHADLDALQSLADQLGVAIRNAQLYAEALAARAEAERADHLKTRLLANVSHELRAPLNVILGYSQAALSDPNPYGAPLPGELLHDLRHIRRSGEHLARLINDLLDLSQAEIGALDIYPEPVDAGALLGELFAAMAGSSARPDVEWRLELPAELAPLTVDPVRLRQIVLNLLSNAAKFTRQGHITLGAVEEADWLHLWVEDTGAGISEALRRRIFESFVTAATESEEGEPGRRGIGLGLSVTHHLVTLHRGRLRLESRPGCGTVCHIYLPLATPPAGVESAASAAVEAVPTTLEPLLASVLSGASELVQRAGRYIGERYTGDLARDEIAAALGVSPDYLSRLFRREMGMSLRQYLTRFRVAQAQKLLAQPQLTITQIAGQVGIDDPAYFSRVFHQETGRTPQQYRKSTS